MSNGKKREFDERSKVFRKAGQSSKKHQNPRYKNKDCISDPLKGHITDKGAGTIMIWERFDREYDRLIMVKHNRNVMLLDLAETLNLDANDRIERGLLEFYYGDMSYETNPMELTEAEQYFDTHGKEMPDVDEDEAICIGSNYGLYDEEDDLLDEHKYWEDELSYEPYYL